METTVDALNYTYDQAFNNPVWWDKFTEEIERQIKANLQKNLAWTTNLKNNLNTSIENKTIIRISMPAYAYYVEYGRSGKWRGNPAAKQPPILVIEKWCKSKGIPEKYAFPIARHIGRYGLPAHHFIEESKNIEVNDIINELIKETLNNPK
jgi:hypothetical protein